MARGWSRSCCVMRGGVGGPWQRNARRVQPETGSDIIRRIRIACGSSPWLRTRETVGSNQHLVQVIIHHRHIHLSLHPGKVFPSNPTPRFRLAGPSPSRSQTHCFPLTDPRLRCNRTPSTTSHINTTLSRSAPSSPSSSRSHSRASPILCTPISSGLHTCHIRRYGR